MRATGRLARAAVAVALFPTLAAAQTAVQGSGGARASLLMFELSGDRGAVRLDTVGARAVIERPWRDVYRAAIGVLGDLGVPVTVADSAAGSVGSAAFTASRRLGRAPLAEYLDCGTGITGPNANLMRARMAVLVFARPRDSVTTDVRTAVVATGRSLDGAARSELACTSTGRLEDRVRGALLLALPRTR